MAGFDWGAFGGDALGAGLGFIGGLIGEGQQMDMYNQNMNWNQQQFNWQQYLANNSIQMRVADAKKAGISPLAALGVPSFGGGIVSGPQSFDVGNPLKDIASGVGRMGQDISRSMQAGMSQEQRDENAARIGLMAAQTEETKARTAVNVATEASIKARMAGNPAVPSGYSETGGLSSQGQVVNVPSSVPFVDWQMGSGGSKNVPPSVPTHATGDPAVESGRAHPYTRLMVQGEGSQAGLIAEPPSGSAATFGGPLGLDWYMRNRISPNASDANKPTMGEVARTFPGATGVYWNYPSQKWMPLYNWEKAPWYGR